MTKKEVWNECKTTNEWADGYYMCDICERKCKYYIMITINRGK